MADRFYTSSALAIGPVVLQGPEAHHLTTVRRFRPGDVVTLFNGNGHEYPAEVLCADRRQVSLNVLRVEEPLRELPFRLEVAAPLPKGDRADFLIEKLTELGATDFVPLRTERSIVHAHNAKLERLQRAVIEASKQCGRNVLMQVHATVDWNDYCRGSQLPPTKLLAHFDGEVIPPPARRDICLAFGPEGGFTEAEIDLARTTSWRLVALGPRTLRVETAALAFTALVGIE